MSFLGDLGRGTVRSSRHPGHEDGFITTASGSSLPWTVMLASRLARLSTYFPLVLLRSAFYAYARPNPRVDGSYHLLLCRSLLLIDQEPSIPIDPHSKYRFPLPLTPTAWFNHPQLPPPPDPDSPAQSRSNPETENPHTASPPGRTCCSRTES